ncbi:MAG: type IV secretory system conjugative DNA transfer family protein [Cellvibrionaceae bacterium]
MQNDKPNVFAVMIGAGLFGWAALNIGPLTVMGQPQLLPILITLLAVVCVIQLVIMALNLLASFAEWLSAHTPSGQAGTSRWAEIKDIRHELCKSKQGPFWGRMAYGKKAALFSDYASNALTIAPAGSGKGIYTVINNGLSIRESKLMPDFKGELACVLKKPLEERGENVIILNPGGLWAEQLGKTASYSPIDIIVNDFYRSDGLHDVTDDLRELSMQLYPEPEGKQGENTYFREGSRRLIADVILLQAILEEADATLASVSLMIEDRQQLERHLRWIVGIDLEGKPLSEGPLPIEHTEWAAQYSPADIAEFAALVRAKANNNLILMQGEESRTFDSFISGAQQALAPFAFGRLSKAMQRSTFSMDELKGDTPTTLFIVADSSRMESYKAFVGLMQWCAFTAIKRHKNKDVPVYAIMDEATNYKIHGLKSLLTWGRAYGLRAHLIFQDFSAFEDEYGEKTLETLLSETEVKQFLPGQRSPKTLERIEKMLGEQSVMLPGDSEKESSGVQGGGRRESTNETARPLMKVDEIRRTKHGILIVRQLLPILFEPIAYAEIKPWRNIVGINPFHSKPFLKKIKLKF